MSAILVNFSIFIHGTQEYMLLNIPSSSTILDVKVIFSQEYDVPVNSLNIVIEGILKNDEELLPPIRELINIASIHVVHKKSSKVYAFRPIHNGDQMCMPVDILDVDNFFRC